MPRLLKLLRVISVFGFLKDQIRCVLPASMTRTRSQSMTVGILWAMLMIVHEAKSSLMIRWITASVWESTDAVASSRKRSRLRFSITLPRHRSCLCPTLQLSPLSTTVKSNHILCKMLEKDMNQANQDLSIDLVTPCKIFFPPKVKGRSWRIIFELFHLFPEKQESILVFHFPLSAKTGNMFSPCKTCWLV